MTSSRKEIENAIIAAINEDPNGELREFVMSIPEKVEKTVRDFTPVLTGETKSSIEVKTRKTEYKRLSMRKIKIGEVYSDDDPERVNAIEYGRKNGDHGETDGAHMFAKAVDVWQSILS